MAIKRISMRDQVYEIIKNRILSKKYALGETINIVHLSQELGTSNTPIREALSQLETEHLITMNANQKYQVTDLTQKEIEDLDTVVFIHLFGAYKICLENGNIPILLSMLREALAHQQALCDTENSSDFVEASLTFVRSFVIAAENSMLIKTFDIVMTILRLSFRYDKISHRQNNIQAHKNIVAAIEQGDIEKTKILLQQHYHEP